MDITKSDKKLLQVLQPLLAVDSVELPNLNTIAEEFGLNVRNVN